MSHKTYELQAQLRVQTGKGAAREIRRNGKIPAIIYGDQKPPVLITLPLKDVYQKIEAGGFLTKITTIIVDEQKIQTLPKDVHLHPVKDIPTHVDFLRVSDDTEVNIKVPVHFINEEKSPGLKRGGSLNIVSHEIELHCAVTAMPEQIVIDLTGAEIGDSIHISSIKLPEKTRSVISDHDFTIATITGSSSSEESDKK